jgi:hypothetical protein
VSLGHIRVLHVPSSRQFADIMTKGLPSQLFLDFRYSYAFVHPTHKLRGDVRVYLYSCISLVSYGNLPRPILLYTVW